MSKGILSTSELKALMEVDTGTLDDYKMTRKLELILDMNLELSIRLGNSRKKIKEILKMQTGTVVELNRMINEPVDLLVNGKLIARGEVVAIGEHFGVKVTSIIKPTDRITGVI